MKIGSSRFLHLSLGLLAVLPFPSVGGCAAIDSVGYRSQRNCKSTETPVIP
jgi:hypothetical protein